MSIKTVRRGLADKALSVFLAMVLAVSFVPISTDAAYADEGDSYERSLPQNDEGASAQNDEGADADTSAQDGTASAQSDDISAQSDDTSVILSDSEGSQTDAGDSSPSSQNDEGAASQTDAETTVSLQDTVEPGSTITADCTVEKGGTYYLGKGAGVDNGTAGSGTPIVVTVSTVEPVVFEGNGATWDDDLQMTSTPNGVLFDCSGTPDVDITFKNVYNAPNVYSERGNQVNFAGTGNILRFEGVNVMDWDGNVTGYASFHVPDDASLTVLGTGTAYLYKREQGAMFGGNGNQGSGSHSGMNGTITFGDENTKSGPTLFMKNTKQGALIGAGAGSNGTGEPGPITFWGGTYNLIANSRGAAIGGSAGSTGASSGTKVYIHGGSININCDYSGAAIGGGGYANGNDASGGYLYVSGGSLRTYIDKNAANNLPDGYNGKLLTEGVNDALITAERYNGDGTQRVYRCAIDTSLLVTPATTFDVDVDGVDWFNGVGHEWSYVQELLDKGTGEQLEITSTPSNWVAGNETNLYLYLPAGKHIVTVNSEVFDVAWDSATETFSATTSLGTWDVSAAGDGSATAELRSDGRLVISGSGATKTFLSKDDQPWADVRDKIVAVEISDEVNATSLAYWFTDCTALAKVTGGIPDGVTDLTSAFENTAISETPALPSGVRKLDRAFANCASLAYLPEGFSVPASASVTDMLTVTLADGSKLATYCAKDDYSALSTLPSAAGQTWDDWGRTLNSSWYLPSLDSLTISTPAELAEFAQIVNGTSDAAPQDDFEGKTVTLAADLDLSDYADWTPIGGQDAPFAGTFDGAGKAITNMTISDASSGYHGLFGNSEGTLKDFSLSGSVGTADSPLAVELAEDEDSIGGVVGTNSGTISDVSCSVGIYLSPSSGTYGVSASVGGIAGLNGAAGVIERCSNVAYVSGASNVGGIVGTNSGDITECFNAGQVAGLDSRGGYYVGGIVGCNGNSGGSYAKVVASYNTGTVSNAYNRKFAGIAGITYHNTTITGCYEIGTLDLGGKTAYDENPIVGQISIDSSTRSCTVEGNYSLSGLPSTKTTEDYVGIATSEADFKVSAMTGKLNQDERHYVADSGTAQINGGYPVLVWQVSGADTATLSYITASGAPETSYIEGQTFDAGTLAVTAVYSDGSLVGTQAYTPTLSGKSIDKDAYGFTMGDSGKTLYVSGSFGGKSYRFGPFTVSVGYKLPEKITAVSGTPSNMLFAQGQSLPAESLTATVNFNDGTTSTVSAADDVGLTYSVASPLSAEANGQTLQVVYELNGTKVTYDVGTLEIIGQIGTDENGAYEIGTADELRWLSAEVNDTARGNVGAVNAVLSADITVPADVAFSPIGTGTSSGRYAGTFDGQGHTVTLEDFKWTSSSSFGLFGVTVGATVKNVVVKGSLYSTNSITSGVASVVGRAYPGTTVTGCRSEATVNAPNSNYVGGVVGKTEAGEVVISECGNSGDVTGKRGVGGVVGGVSGNYSAGATSISDCYNTGHINGKSTTVRYGVGGIVGTVATTGSTYSIVASNCYNAGQITTDTTSTSVICAAIFAGDQYQVGTVENCYYLADGTIVAHAGADQSKFTKDTATGVDDDTLKAASTVSALNAERSVWAQDESSLNGGYPVLKSHLIVVSKPSATTGYVYDGQEHVGVTEGKGYSLTGDAKATNAGDYTVTATLGEGWTSWDDGTTASLELSWSISKATLTARALDAEVTYADALQDNYPDFTIEVTGFAAGESAETAAGYTAPISMLEIEVERDATGTITPVGGAADNYGFEYVAGTITVVDATADRLYGDTALDTMGAILADGFADGSCADSYVVIATMGGYHDALTAAGLAGLGDAPVLITDGTSLSEQTASEIVRLGATKAYIAGGTVAVSADVEAQIEALGVTVIRAAGDDARDTALDVYEKGKAEGGWGTTAIVASSTGYHDALAASPYSYAKNAPIFLADPDTHALEDDVLEAIASGGFTRVLVCGGKAALSNQVEAQIENLDAGIEVVRKWGDTAIETSIAIAEWCVDDEGMGADGVAVATSESYYDALSGAAFCGQNNAPLLLVSDDNRACVDDFIAPRKDAISDVYILGGPAAVSDVTRAAIDAALK